MTFVVTGTTPDGSVTFTFETPLPALRKARDLKETKAADVVITDCAGLVFTPADFEHAYVTEGRAPTDGDGA